MSELEYEDEDLVTWGVEFDKALLLTDESVDMQRRRGQACIHIVEAILEDVLANLREDVGDDDEAEGPEASDPPEDPPAFPV